MGGHGTNFGLEERVPMGTREKANKCRKCGEQLKTRKAKLCPNCSRREALPKMWEKRRKKK